MLALRSAVVQSLIGIRAAFSVRTSDVSCCAPPPRGIAFAMPPSTCAGRLTGQLVETAHLKKMLPKLKRACAEMPFLLCGPPGCGKKCALRLALGEKKLTLHDIAEISNERGTKLDALKELVRMHAFGQQMLTGEGEAEPSVLVLYGAEHLDGDCVQYLCGQRGKLKVVLLASERGNQLTRFPIVWVKRPNFTEVVDFLRLLFPQISDERTSGSKELRRRCAASEAGRGVLAAWLRRSWLHVQQRAGSTRVFRRSARPLRRTPR